MKITTKQLKKIIKEELLKVINEADYSEHYGEFEYTDDYDGHPGPGWEKSHEDPKSGHIMYKRPKAPRSSQTSKPFTEPNYSEHYGEFEFIDDYDGHPGPDWEKSHQDAKSGHTMYRRPKRR